MQMCRKITKIVATRCQILRLKCIKFNFGWGYAPDPAWELTAFPRPLAGFKGPTSKAREGKGKERERGKRVKSYILLPQFFFCNFSSILGVITYIGNRSDRGEHGGKKQFKYVSIGYQTGSTPI